MGYLVVLNGASFPARDASHVQDGYTEHPSAGRADVLHWPRAEEQCLGPRSGADLACACVSETHIGICGGLHGIYRPAE